MANFLYVDNSNVWIEGMHVSAVVNGLAPNIFAAQEFRICDRDYSVDFGKLFKFAGGDRADVGRAVLYGSGRPENDSLWNIAKKNGFEVIVHDWSRYTGREKKIDTNIVYDITEDSHALMKPEKDEITLVAGDKDYVPAVLGLRKRGLKFYVCFWDHAARELKEAATQFVSLNQHLQLLKLKR